MNAPFQRQNALFDDVNIVFRLGIIDKTSMIIKIKNIIISMYYKNLVSGTFYSVNLERFATICDYLFVITEFFSAS
jgi:hypothetical protein